jgi:hypothetical protein
LAVLESDTEALTKRFGAEAKQAPAQLQVRLVGELGKLAQAQGATLHGVVPAPEETVLAFYWRCRRRRR